MTIYATDPINLGELTDDDRAVTYREQRWACPPPEVGTRYRVLRDEWSDDYMVRTIHAWVEVFPE